MKSLFQYMTFKHSLSKYVLITRELPVVKYYSDHAVYTSIYKAVYTTEEGEAGDMHHHYTLRHCNNSTGRGLTCNDRIKNRISFSLCYNEEITDDDDLNFWRHARRGTLHEVSSVLMQVHKIKNRKGKIKTLVLQTEQSLDHNNMADTRNHLLTQCCCHLPCEKNFPELETKHSTFRDRSVSSFHLSRTYAILYTQYYIYMNIYI